MPCKRWKDESHTRFPLAGISSHPSSPTPMAAVVDLPQTTLLQRRWPPALQMRLPGGDRYGSAGNVTSPRAPEASQCRHKSAWYRAGSSPQPHASLTVVTPSRNQCRGAPEVSGACVRTLATRGERRGGRAYDSDSDSSDIEELPLWRRASSESEIPSTMDFENLDALAVQREAQRLAAKQAVDRISVSSPCVLVCCQQALMDFPGDVALQGRGPPWAAQAC